MMTRLRVLCAKCVTWRSPPPTVATENIWQLSNGFVPNGSADAMKKARVRERSRNPVKVSARREFVSWMRFLPFWTKASVTGKYGSCVSMFGGLTGVPGSAKRTRLVRSPVTPKLGTTSLPGTAIGGGTRFRLVPSIRTVKAAAVCAGFEPSGSTNVWKRTVSLSMKVGQQVRRNFPLTPPGAVPDGRRVTSVRRPVARSSITICAASSPPGPGPRSVKAIRRPFGLKAIGGEKEKAGSKLFSWLGRQQTCVGGYCSSSVSSGRRKLSIT
jgi:hypothetical protein